MRAESPCVCPLQNIYCDCAEEIRSTLEHSLIIFPGNTSEECGWWTWRGAIVRVRTRGDAGTTTSPHNTSPASAIYVIDNSDKGVWNVGTDMKESPMPCVPLCLVLRFHTAIPYSYHSQSLPSIGYIMDVYKMSFSICKKSLSLCESEEDSGSTAHSWTRQQAGVSGEQNTAVVGSGVGGGFMSLHCGCGRVIEAAMRKLVSCPQHCHMVSLGPH